jgi:hypothetical protein
MYLYDGYDGYDGLKRVFGGTLGTTHDGYDGFPEHFRYICTQKHDGYDGYDGFVLLGFKHVPTGVWGCRYIFITRR